MASTVAEIVVATLKASGVRRVYGIPGDSLARAATTIVSGPGQETPREAHGNALVALSAAIHRLEVCCDVTCGSHGSIWAGLPASGMILRVDYRRFCGRLARSCARWMLRT